MDKYYVLALQGRSTSQAEAVTTGPRRVRNTRLRPLPLPVLVAFSHSRKYHHHFQHDLDPQSLGSILLLSRGKGQSWGDQGRQSGVAIEMVFPFGQSEQDLIQINDGARLFLGSVQVRALLG